MPEREDKSNALNWAMILLVLISGVLCGLFIVLAVELIGFYRLLGALIVVWILTTKWTYKRG